MARVDLLRDKRAAGLPPGKAETHYRAMMLRLTRDQIAAEEGGRHNTAGGSGSAAALFARSWQAAATNAWAWPGKRGFHLTTSAGALRA